MKIYHVYEVVASLKNSTWLFLDTSALIALIEFQELFTPFFKALQQKGISLATIPSVAFEFSRSDTLEKFIKRSEFLKKLCDIYPIERYFSQISNLVPIIQKVAGGLSYTDFLLYCCIYKFNGKSYLLSEDKHFTPTILNREGVLTIDSDTAQIRNLSFYSFSASKYEKAAATVLLH